MTRRHLLGRIATVVALAATTASASALLPVGNAAADTSPGPTVLPTCQPEQFPHAGAPRTSAAVPYEIPFTATLGPDPEPAAGAPTQGGWLEIDGHSRLLPGATVSVILGGPIAANGNGAVYAKGCGRVQLPSETGGIGASYYPPAGPHGGQVNPNFQFSPNIPVSISVSLPGISLPTGIVASGTADGFLASTIERTPAANGGLNVDFYSTAKSTTNLSALLALFGGSVGGSDCTVAIGDLRETGLPVPPGGVDGLTYPQATTPVHLSTTQTARVLSSPMTFSGQPVTGPIAPNAQGHSQTRAVLVANSFPVAAIDPNMPPSPNFTGGTATCSQSNATLLNNLIGLPAQPGQSAFYAPGTFGVYTSS